MSSALDRLKNLTNKISGYETARKENLRRLKKLFEELEISKKVDTFEDIFLFKAINLSGASLQKENLGEVKEGKYLQILAISYDKDAVQKSKNISLGYFGRAENVDVDFKNSVVEFVIRYRFEKSFMTLEHYNDMLGEFGKESE
jgi:hypothetical protein